MGNWMLWGAGLTGAFFVGRALLKPRREPQPSDDPLVAENIESSYTRCDSTVTIYNRTHKYQGTVGYRATVSGEHFFSEMDFAELGAAMEWAETVACA